jgi:multidrug resistance efflux pump
VLHARSQASTLRLVISPAYVRRIAWSLAVLLPGLALLLLLLPWQQAALGTGRVIAFAPEHRVQNIDAAIDGVIGSWHIVEGQRVQEGDLLVTLRDNDPDRLSRLERSLGSGQNQASTIAEQIRSYEAKLAAATAARDLKVAEARSKVASLEQKRVGLEATAAVESLQSDRQATLAAEGIASQRDAEVARMKAAKASAQLAALQAEIAAARQAMATARADGDAKVAEVQAELQAARAKLNEAEQKLLDAESKVRQQEAQQIRAPRDGTVQQVRGGPGGTQVKKGDLLVQFVPETASRAVELWLDGNDMPLVEPGEQVRLLFEGWPAIQVVGFPGADAGTYAGRVVFVDPTDDGKGHFRVVVRPDDDAPPWPDADRLRQGVRAKGWVLLGQVSLGYELWRRINGFPSLPPVDKGDKPVLPSGKKPKAPRGLQ